LGYTARPCLKKTNTKETENGFARCPGLGVHGGDGIDYEGLYEECKIGVSGSRLAWTRSEFLSPK
jgi:hypothetical protein